MIWFRMVLVFSLLGSVASAAPTVSELEGVVSEWVKLKREAVHEAAQWQEERAGYERELSLIKLSLKGLMGPIEVKGKAYPGLVPMTPFEGMLNDEEMAAVLTYVRNSFGNKADPVSASQVKAVRSAEKSKQGFYSPAELLKAHPHR